jgi:hypothetical protein
MRKQWKKDMKKQNKIREEREFHFFALLIKILTPVTLLRQADQHSLFHNEFKVSKAILARRYQL